MNMRSIGGQYALERDTLKAALVLETQQHERACRQAMRWEMLARDLAHDHLGMTDQQFAALLEQYHLTHTEE
jgi:hypothetical protein